MSYANNRLNKIKGIFIHINKCGGSSVKSILYNCDNIVICQNNRNGSDVNISTVQNWPEYKDIFSFTIIRHPFSRFISAYKMVLRDSPELKYTIDKFIDIATNPNLSYDKFDRGKNKYIKRHTLPLTHPHYGIVGDDGSINVKFVAKLENIQKDWSIIKSKIGIHQNLPKINATNNKKIILNKTQKEKLLEYYKKDFEIFKYNPNVY